MIVIARELNTTRQRIHQIVKAHGITVLRHPPASFGRRPLIGAVPPLQKAPPPAKRLQTQEKVQPARDRFGRWISGREPGIEPAVAETILLEIGKKLPDGGYYSNEGLAGQRAAWRVVQKYLPDKSYQQARQIISAWVRDGTLHEIQYIDHENRRRTGLRRAESGEAIP